MDSIRRSMLLKRASMSLEDRKNADKDIFERITAFKGFADAQRIFTYVNTDAEAETKALISYALREGKKVFVPVTLKERMYFTRINSLNELKKTKMGIPEPEGTTEEMPLKGDLFIIPGSVFDKEGHRYGYGAGYYDRYLALCGEVLKVALCYDFQLADHIETKAHDIDMDIIITDKRTVICNKGGKHI